MKYTLALISSIFLFSCTKNELPMSCDVTLPVIPEFPLSIGSYWVYDLTRVTDGDSTFVRTDTLFLTGEEMIEGELYSEFSDLTTFPNYLRQSGEQLFTPNNLWAMLQTGDSISLSADTIFTGEQPLIITNGYMSSESKSISVPAGDFSCFHRLAQYTATDPDYPYGVRTDNYFIADAVGVVQFNYFFYSTSDCFYYQLVDYHLE